VIRSLIVNATREQASVVSVCVCDPDGWRAACFCPAEGDQLPI